jgi:hypothetical protein
MAKGRGNLEVQVPPPSHPSPHLAPSARAGLGPQDPGQPIVGRVLTGNGITADGDGYDSLIGGWVKVRVGFAVIRS